jgi:hypothetical protein
MKKRRRRRRKKRNKLRTITANHFLELQRKKGMCVSLEIFIAEICVSNLQEIES